MAQEIERKFLVNVDALGELKNGNYIHQGFIPTSDLTAVRVRISGDQAWLTIKGKTTGFVRSEFEYSIPKADAQAMLDELCSQPQISKTRYNIEYCGYVWEVDVFLGDNEGLVVAEVEFENIDADIKLPPWVLDEVTNDSRYYNVNLAKHPFKHW